MCILFSPDLSWKKSVLFDFLHSNKIVSSISLASPCQHPWHTVLSGSVLVYLPPGCNQWHICQVIIYLKRWPLRHTSVKISTRSKFSVQTLKNSHPFLHSKRTLRSRRRSQRTQAVVANTVYFHYVNWILTPSSFADRLAGDLIWSARDWTLLWYLWVRVVELRYRKWRTQLSFWFKLGAVLSIGASQAVGLTGATPDHPSHQH